jgi:hypothetical protein
MSKKLYDPCEGLDKRTKKYKQCRKRFEAKLAKMDVEAEEVGLGDVVEKVIKATGIKKVVEWLSGEDCGCEERKQRMNQIKFFSKRRVKCLTEDEFGKLDAIYDKIASNKVTRPMIHVMIPIYNRVFGYGYDMNTSCNSCIRSITEGIRDLMKFYKDEQEVVN